MRIPRFFTMSCISLALARSSFAAIVFQSGTLGPTDVTKAELLNQTVLGTNVNPDVFVGVRFELTHAAMTSRIGGHFAGGFGSDVFFGAITKLSDISDFPDSDDLSSSDVIGQALLSFPHPSQEVLTDFSVMLEPGWYALVFGSGLFGASGTGGAVRNGLDIGTPSYIGWQTGGTGWFNLSDLSEFHLFNNHHFVIEGHFTPEPATISLLVAAFLTIASMRERRQCRRSIAHRVT
ncbi:MAG: hypothetical protein WD669_11645 [Pirellulales bacterium]